MINGVVVGIVLDNVDPDKMHRVKVQYPVASGDELKSSWCRMITPMAGTDRGLVILPDVGTEVIRGFAYRTMSPYVLGGVYNGDEDLAPYKNLDTANNKRVLWTRNDHQVIFDDTDGQEKVELGAQASTRLDVTSGPIYQSLDSAKMVITEYCDGSTEWEAVNTISIKCTDFKLEASNSIDLKADMSAAFKSDSSTKIESVTTQTYEATMVNINPSAPPADPLPAETLPEHIHPPTS
jgi:uncharacterized protein involved in type VI secretion and phage assembly